MRFAIRHAAATVELELATVEEHLLERAATALNTGFCAGHGNAESLRQFHLRHAFDLRPHDGFAIRFGQGADHPVERGAQVGMFVGAGVGFSGQRVWQGDGLRLSLAQFLTGFAGLLKVISC